LERIPYSYRRVSQLPEWDEDKDLIVFDGECIFCSSFVQFVLGRDDDNRFLFTSAQGPLGQALYRHYGLDPDDFETNLVLSEGRLYEKLAAFSHIMSRLGLPWSLLAWLGALPKPMANWCYDRIARNRYALFGRRETCLVPVGKLKERFIDAQ